MAKSRRGFLFVVSGLRCHVAAPITLRRLSAKCRFRFGDAAWQALAIARRGQRVLASGRWHAAATTTVNPEHTTSGKTLWRPADKLRHTPWMGCRGLDASIPEVAMSLENTTEPGSDTGASNVGESANRPPRYEGVRAGVLGAASVWAWVFVSDLWQHTPFNTAARFGRWFISIDRVTSLPRWGDVLGFTVILLAVWIVFGRLAARAIRTVPREPATLIFIVFMLTLLQLAAVVIAAMLAARNTAVLAWRDFYVGQLIGWAVVWWYLVRHHPEAMKAWRMAGRD
jgi:hypothetical protein